MEKEILTIADASELLSLPEDEVARLLAEGDLPGRRIGPHWYISRQRLLEFIAEVTPPPEPSNPQRYEVPKSIPEKVLSPNWRCDTCQKIYPPEQVECAHCGTVRNTPLMGFRLPRPTLGTGTNPLREFN